MNLHSVRQEREAGARFYVIAQISQEVPLMPVSVNELRSRSNRRRPPVPLGVGD